MDIARFWHLQLHRTTLVGLGCLAFLLGIGGVACGLQLHGWLGPVVAACMLLLCIKRRLLVALPAVIVAGACVGLWRGSDVQWQLGGYQPYIQQQVQLSGTVKDDPTYDDQGRLDMRLTQVYIGQTSLPGEVRLKSFALLQPRRGDKVAASGKLVDGFGNYQAAIYFAHITSLQQPDNWIENLRRQFAASVLSYVAEPAASLGLGFLIGLKSQLPDELDEQLKLLGLTHIVVASGYNVTILVRLSRRLFYKRSKYQALLASSSLIAGFLAVTGFSPSMSRAALVTGLALAAWYYGRVIHPLVLLLVAAGITAAFNPLYVWHDLGWWLSFLAFAGVLLLAPALQKRLFGQREPKLLGQVVLETIAAQALTLPLILFIFGDLSVLSLLANVLVVPLIPLAMLLIFIAGLVGLLLPAIAAYIALPAGLLLGYIVEVVRLLASFPWASAQVPIALPVMLAAYGALVTVWLILWRKSKLDYRNSSLIE